MTQLAEILDVGKFSLYTRLNYLKETDGGLQRDYQIDIDEFLSQQKVNDFLFEFEEKGTSFSEQLKAYNFSEFISVDEVKNILDINNYELRKLRVSGDIDFKKVSAKRFLYETNSVLKYAYQVKNKAKLPYRFKYSKQFYSPTEIQEILNEKYGIIISRKTLYRYIYTYNVVPCIKVSGNLRIPILEFNKSVQQLIERLHYS
jgi:predicted transcriptional regulator